MNKGKLASFMAGLLETHHGQSYRSLLRYFCPELISGFLLYSLLNLIDAAFIASAGSITMYATVGVTSALIHFITKVAEGLTASIVILGGRFNGAGSYSQVGRVFFDALIMNSLIGLSIAVGMYSGMPFFFKAYGVSQAMAAQGIPFLRVRAISVFLLFIYLSCTSFLRSIKDNKTPMIIFALGAAIFIFFDYVLIFGKLGFPKLGLMGSAIAAAVQYGVMTILGLAAVFSRHHRAKYSISLFNQKEPLSHRKKLFHLGWPVAGDKSIMSAGYLWLGVMIMPMGEVAMASFAAIKDLINFVILPSIAFSQIITFLTSNDFGAYNWRAIKANSKKTFLLTTLMVLGISLVFSWNVRALMTLFDANEKFIPFARKVFIPLCFLSLFDVLQTIFAGIMRGAARVLTVMRMRLIMVFGYFVPCSYVLTLVPFAEASDAFMALYASYFLGSAVMCWLYIKRLHGKQWSPIN